MKKNLPYVLAVVTLLIGFYGGLKYGQSQRGNFTRQQMGQRFPGADGLTNRGNRNAPAGGGFVNGEILSQDDKSITVKLRDGGSKIIFFSDSTGISKTADGAPTDLAVGKEITATGSANSDGSITAQSIQIRPATPVSPSDKNPK